MARELVKDSAARSDLVGTWVYSFEHWGEALADRYQNALEQGIRTLAVEPREGKRREVVRKGYWSRRIEHHVVFYTFTDTEVRIRRVLHGAMDPRLHL